MVDFCCVKGSSALKNTTNTSGCLASLHLGFKLSQDVFSDCFSCLYQLFSGCTRQQHTNVAKFGGTAQTLQFHGLNSQFYRDASGQLFLRRVLFTGSVDKVKKKKKKITPEFLHFFLVIFVPFLLLKCGWFCRAEFTCIPRAGLVTTKIVPRVVFDEKCTGCGTCT